LVFSKKINYNQSKKYFEENLCAIIQITFQDKGVRFVKNLIISNSLNLIKKNDPDITNEKIEIIEYGLVSIYLLISKMIIIIVIAIILGIVKELLMFIFLYSIIRLTSFGLHASKSWICLIASSIIFIGSTILCMNLVIPNRLKIIIGIISTLFILKNSPADTHKRPIVNPKRRMFFKIISTIISILYVIFSLITKNNFLSNCFILAIGCQTLFISPTVYKIFKLPYNNYKNYNLENN